MSLTRLLKPSVWLPPGSDAAGERVGADLDVVVSPILDQGEARIGNDVRGLVAVVGNLAGRPQGVGVEAFVDVDLGVEQIVPQHVGPGPDAALGKAAVDQGRRHRGRRQRRSVVGKAPDRRRVPGVRYRRTVVGGQAPEQVLTRQLALARMPDIDLVEMSLPGDAVIGHLDEPADLRRDLARVVGRHGVHDEVVVRLEAGRRAAWLRLPGVGEGGTRRHRQRKPMVLAVVADIAMQLEIAPERLQLRAESSDMAGRAGLAGLHREGRDRLRRARAERGEQQQDQRSRPTGSQPDPSHGLESP